MGLTYNEFKTRFNLHKSSFELGHKKSNTSLSEYIRHLNNKKAEYNIEIRMENSETIKALRTKQKGLLPPFRRKV